MVPATPAMPTVMMHEELRRRQAGQIGADRPAGYSLWPTKMLAAEPQRFDPADAGHQPIAPPTQRTIRCMMPR